MTDQPSFTPYPSPGEPQRQTVLLITRATGDSTSPVQTKASEPMTESYALQCIERLASGESLPDVRVRDSDTIVQISEREVVLFTSSFWRGRHSTRVQVGHLRREAQPFLAEPEPERR